MAALLIIVPKWKQNGKNKHPSIKAECMNIQCLP